MLFIFFLYIYESDKGGYQWMSWQVPFNLFMPNEISLSYQLDQPITFIRIVGWYISFLLK